MSLKGSVVKRVTQGLARNRGGREERECVWCVGSGVIVWGAGKARQNPAGGSSKQLRYRTDRKLKRGKPEETQVCHCVPRFLL